MTYRPNFSGLHAKIDRGIQHVETLTEKSGISLSPSNRIPMRLEYEPDTGYHVYRAAAGLSEATIRQWGLIIGDAVHNFRSALDHLVWQLACYRTGGANLPGVPVSESRRVQFPIDNRRPHEEPRRFHENDNLKHVLPEHRAIIYEHQPFGSRQLNIDLPMHPLIRLRNLSNEDKHRIITPIAVLTDRFLGFTNPEELFRGAGGEIVEKHYRIEDKDKDKEPMERGTEIIRVRVQPADIKLNLALAGYVVPTPSFRDVTCDNTTHITPVDLELMAFIALSIRSTVNEFQQLF
jgi:hypothetical protein